MLDNMDSPGLAATFRQLNQEVLGIVAPADEVVHDDDDDDAHNESEAQMKAELWEDPGLYLPPPRHIWK